MRTARNSVRLRTPALALAFTMLPMLAQAQTSCIEATTTAEMQRCTSGTAQSADAELNALYGKLIKVLKERDAAVGAGKDGAETRLRTAQRAWITFRDAECALESYAVAGGTLEGVEKAACLDSLTRERNGHLTRLVESFDR